MNDHGFVKVYVALVRETGPYIGKADSLVLVRQRVLKEHGWTEEGFTAYGDRYRDRPEQWLEIWKKVQREMEKSTGRDGFIPGAKIKNPDKLPPGARVRLKPKDR